MQNKYQTQMRKYKQKNIYTIMSFLYNRAGGSQCISTKNTSKNLLAAPNFLGCLDTNKI